MVITTLAEESRRSETGGFYVPRFEVRIAGAGLSGDVLRDVIQLTYKDNIKEIDSFELTVNNWDPTTNNFKYIGAETAAALAADDEVSRRYRLFEPCGGEVEIWLGYLDALQLMVTGNFITMEPNFPASGAPTLTVRGLNVLHQLRRKQFTTAWTDKKDSEIAENIATLRDDQTKEKRFPLPIITEPTAKNSEPQLEYLAQKNQHDIEFLLERARERGYVVFVKEPDDEHPERRLYFGPSDGGRSPGLRDVTFELEWGKSLIDFKPTLTTANQVRSVTVNGWDRRTRRPIQEKVSIDDQKLKQNKDLHDLLSQRCDPREDIVVEEPIFSPKQARERAIALLTERQKEMVKATGSTVGLPDLRAGRRVQIKGLGSRFSGAYFVTETTHTISDSGYITRFNARREESGGGNGP